jgi:hypothetical protein
MTGYWPLRHYLQTCHDKRWKCVSRKQNANIISVMPGNFSAVLMGMHVSNRNLLPIFKISEIQWNINNVTDLNHVCKPTQCDFPESQHRQIPYHLNLRSH